MTNLSEPSTSLTVWDLCHLMDLSYESKELNDAEDLEKLRVRSSSRFWDFVDAYRQLLVHEMTLPPGSLELAEAMFPMAANRDTPGIFRHWIAERVLKIYARSLDRTDPRWLKLFGVIAHTAPTKPLREAAFVLLVQQQCISGAGNPARMSSLANLAVVYEENGHLEEAVRCFRHALEFGGHEYLSLRLSQCLAKLGRYEEAYKLVSDFAQCYFSSENADEGDEILHEARLDC